MIVRLFSILLIFICSCSRDSSKPQNDEITVIDLLSKPKSSITNISDIASDVEYIPFQTIDNSLIRSIDKVVVIEDRIYVKNNVFDIMCFDNQGNFVHKLSQQGRGPGEYLYIYDFDISSDNTILAILSGSEILIFNNTGFDFVFQKSIYLRRPAPIKLDMVYGTSNIFLSVAPWYGTEPSLSILISIDGDTLCFKPNCYKYEYKYEPGGRMYVSTNESIQYTLNSKVCFKEEFSDTIFSVGNELSFFTPRLILDTKGKIFPAKARGDQEYARSLKGKCYYIADVSETSRYVIYDYHFNDLRFKELYDKVKNEKYELALENALKDDLSGGPNLDIDFVRNGKIYSLVDAFTLKNYVSSREFFETKAKNPREKEKLKILADKLSETSNPVLIVVTPKN